MKFALDAGPSPWASARRNGGVAAARDAVRNTIAMARVADEAGIDSIWAMEDPDGWDAFAALGAMASQTERIRLGTGVTNPYFRPPALMAASIATLDHLSHGRAFLGLGRGQDEWYSRAMGIHVGKPARAVAETIDLLRQWWSPEMRASSPTGATEFAINAWERGIRPFQEHVPIYIAAVGPVALRLAGRYADGVLFNDLSSTTFLRWAVAIVRGAAIEVGRDPDALEFYARGSLEVTGDPDASFERRKATVAMIHALPGMERLLESPNFDTERIIADVRAAMNTNAILERGGGFGDLRRGGDLAAARRLIPDELMRELVLAGSIDDLRTRLGELAGIGITHVFLAPLAPDATAAEVATLLADLQAPVS